MDDCVFSKLSTHPCGPKRSLNHPLQTLDEIDAGELNLSCSNGSQGFKKLSWMILSRVGINYLRGTDYYGNWVICHNHRKQFLDSWQITESCCHPDHLSRSKSAPASPSFQLNKVVSLDLALKVLQKEGKVLPISGQLCQGCCDVSDKGNIPVPEKISNPVILSPFCVEEPETTNLISSLPTAEVTMPFLDASHPLITIKTEVLEVGCEDDPGEERDENEDDFDEDEDDVSLFSDDSDDDRTWEPVKRKAKGEGLGRGRGRKRKVEFRLNVSSSSSSSSSSSEEEEEEKNEEESLQSSSLSQHFFCKICKISFYKQSSYKQHMRSSKRVHRDIVRKDNEREFEEHMCQECDNLVFQDRDAYDKHMKDVHNKKKVSFYCKHCKVYLKNESAFKSHNSKLHLERRSKLYYCRECDSTFQCKLKHNDHIKTHRLFNESDPRIQCLVCGKMFTNKQELAYQKHLVTHDAENDLECHCSQCESQSRSKGRNKSKSVRQDPSPAESPEQDPLAVPFQCAYCVTSFDDPLDLESHVNDCHREEEVKTKAKRVFTVQPKGDTKDLESSKSRNWQECPDRNWAAEFGYGKKVALNKLQSDDLLSMMRQKFKVAKEDGVEKEDPKIEDENEILFRTRGFKGTVKASPQKIPRTLSVSSLSTRKRMETLIKRAREYQAKQQKKLDRDEETFDGFEDEDTILIPLANGWVCEKKPLGKNNSEFQTAFWSPDGDQFQSIKEIETHLKSAKKKSKVDLTVFQKALTRKPTKIVDLQSG